MPKVNKIRVLIADDHAILRAGLRMLIDSQPDMVVVAEAPDGLVAVDRVVDKRPDVAILDLTMPKSGGLDALHRIVKAERPPRVLLLTMHEDPAYLRTALAAGASGYVLKKAWMQIFFPQFGLFIKVGDMWTRSSPTFWCMTLSEAKCAQRQRMAPTF